MIETLSAPAVLAWMNSGGQSLAVGVMVFLLLGVHWASLIYVRVKFEEGNAEMTVLQRKIWSILIILMWCVMNTSTFSAVWAWLTGICWILAHVGVFVPGDEEKRKSYFKIIMAVSLAMTTVMYFVAFIEKGAQRSGI
jgi:hypothetical protein